MSEYIEFKLINTKTKTKRYQVVNKHHGIVLGTVKWHGAWRQYCFFPELDTLFSVGCMKDICSFIENLMSHCQDCGAPLQTSHKPLYCTDCWMKRKQKSESGGS